MTNLPEPTPFVQQPPAATPLPQPATAPVPLPPPLTAVTGPAPAAAPVPAAPPAAPAAAPVAAPTLRSPDNVFPDAQANVDTPKSSGAVFRKRVTAAYSRRPLVFLLAFVIFIVAAVAAYATHYSFMPVAVAAVILIVGVIFLFIESSRAAKEFWSEYAQARGLTLASGRANISLGANVPLMRKGIDRYFLRSLTGRIGGCDRASLATYRYVIEREVSDGNGNMRTQRQDVDHTVVMMMLPEYAAAHFSGVYCHPHTLSLGHLQDMMTNSRAVQFESSEFNKHYSLRVLDGQDNIALYELFTPDFLVKLIDAKVAYWEQENVFLVMMLPGDVSNAEQLDDLCAAGALVYDRYARLRG